MHILEVEERSGGCCEAVVADGGGCCLGVCVEGR